MKHYRLAFHLIFCFLLSLLAALPALAGVDHGDSCADASPLAVAGRLSGAHETRVDHDHFRLDVTEAGILTVDLLTGGSGESRLRFLGRDCAGAQPREVRFVERGDRRLALIVGAPGSYYLKVVGRAASGGSRYQLRTLFYPDREAVDLVVHPPTDVRDSCRPEQLLQALATAADGGGWSQGGSSDSTDELDSDVVVVPPPRLAGAPSTGAGDPGDPGGQGGSSDSTDELDSDVIVVPPPRLAGVDRGWVAEVLGSTDELDTDVMTLLSPGPGFLVIDAEGTDLLGSLYAGLSCAGRDQLIGDARLGRPAGMVVEVTEGDYVLRLSAAAGAGPYRLRIKYLTAAGD